MNDGKYSRAFALLKDLLKKDPSHQEGRRLLASLLLKFGNLATARSAFDALVKEAIQRKDYPEAEALLREYLASGPRCVPFLEQLGHVYELKGDPYAAVFEYEKAVDVLLDDPDPDRPEYAHELYAKITQLAPSSFVANRVAARFKQMPSKAEPVDSEAPPAAVHDAHPDVEPADVAPEAASSSAAVITEPEQERKQEKEAGSGLPEAGGEASAATPVNDIEQAVVQTAIPQVVGVVRDRNEEEVPFPPVNQPLRFQEPVDENANDDEQADEKADEHVASEEEPRQEEPSLVELVDVEELPGEPRQQPVTLHEAPEAQQESRIVQESHIIPPHEQEVSHPEGQVAEREFPEPPPSVPDKEPEPAAATPITTEPVPEVCSSAVPVLPLGQHADSTWDSPAAVSALPESGASRVTQDLSDPIAPTPVVHSAAAHADIRMADPARPVQEPPMAPTAPPVREAAPKPKRRKARRKLGRGVSTWVSTRVSIIARKVRSFTNSVTKLTIFLCLGAIGAVILLLVAAAVGWLMLDQRPSERFTSLDQVSMPKALDDPKRNGYILMLGVDAEDVVDALQAGYLRWLGTKKESDEGCYDLTPSGQPVVPVPVRMQTPAGWMRSADPAAQFTAEAGRVKGEIDPHGVLLTRYKQWLGLPFEDWGFGNSNVPYCGLFLGIHRLYLADGFAQSLNAGLERLESDLTAWRNVLSKATTLSTKVMAVEGLNDDVAIMSGLLTRPSVDIKVLQRISRLAKPLQEEDRALRWPLHHEFRETIKRMDGRLRSHEEDQAFTAWIAARLPVPKQRVLNDYADYYDAWLKIDAAPNAPPPNFHDFAHTPAQSFADYVVNPIDNVIGRERVVDWEAARGMVLETDARLRLTGLVTRLRSGTGSNMATLVAQAGHTLYDPFTELPMLINMSERKVYSVGRNRKDDGGNPASDVALKFLP
jgi:hypothetical protein